MPPNSAAAGADAGAGRWRLGAVDAEVVDPDSTLPRFLREYRLVRKGGTMTDELIGVACSACSTCAVSSTHRVRSPCA